MAPDLDRTRARRGDRGAGLAIGVGLQHALELHVKCLRIEDTLAFSSDRSVAREMVLVSALLWFAVCVRFAPAAADEVAVMPSPPVDKRTALLDET